MKTIYNNTSNTLVVSSTLTNSKNTPNIDGVFFANVKDKVLGKNYELSVVFVGKKRMRALNKKHRQKDYSTDILSFSVGDDTGEIFINPDKARTKAKEFDRTFSNYIQFLFIHGCFHLKGFDHSDEMEKKEEQIRKVFGV